MSDIRIHRPHTLGLPRAREVAQQWAQQARDQFGMDCTWTPGDAGADDTLTFHRQGVKGCLAVAADRFELTAQLGFLLSAFHKKIEGEIEKNLDALLATPSSGPAKPP